MKNNISDFNRDEFSRWQRVNDIFGNGIDDCSGWYRMSELEDIKYLNFMFDCFSMVRNKTILEIGPGFGWHTKIMLKFNPEKIICVEPDERFESEEVYKKNTDIITFHSCTANDYYSRNNESVDIVVCCCVLYHLHSPIHLLEKIINVSKPKYLLIETVNGDDLVFGNEQFEELGNAHRDENVKFPILKAMHLPANAVIECVETTNYKVDKINQTMGKWNNNPSPSLVSTILFKSVDAE